MKSQIEEKIFATHVENEEPISRKVPSMPKDQQVIDWQAEKVLSDQKRIGRNIEMTNGPKPKY